MGVGETGVGEQGLSPYLYSHLRLTHSHSHFRIIAIDHQHTMYMLVRRGPNTTEGPTTTGV